MSDLAIDSEGAGAWAAGWYRAIIVPAYTTTRAKVFETRDMLAKNATSRNLFVCVAVAGDVFVPIDPNPAKRILTTGPGGTRTIRATYNYKPIDWPLTTEKVAAIKASRERYKNVQGRWPDAEAQATSLSTARLGQLAKALGFDIPFSGGRFDASVLIGQQLDVRLKLDEKGFNEVAAVSLLGSHV
jgi:hypothetical protein